MDNTNSKKLKLTTRGRHAVMAMVELARRDEDKQPVPLADIAASGNISLSYLEQLFAGLRKGGLVKSYRGPGGGYLLTRAAAEILVSDILECAEDCVPAKRAANDDLPSSFGNSQTHALWMHIGEILYACMQQVTLHDVLHQKLDHNPMIAQIFKGLR